MIIESGHDLRLALSSAVRSTEIQGICVLSMDDDLRLISIAELMPHTHDPHGLDPYGLVVEGLVLDRLDEIADLIAEEAPDTRYFALAWSTERAMGEDVGWLRAVDDRIAEEPQLSHVRLLGQIVFASDGMSVTVPQCDFSLYPELRDLPRAVSIPGPHGDDCPCAVCARERRMLGDHYGWDEPEPYRDAYPEPYRDAYSEPYRDWARQYSRATERQGPDFHARRPSLYAAPNARGDAAIDSEPHFDPFWNRWYPDPERAYKKWTPDEEAALAAAHAEGMSCFDISILLRRQPGAIASRLNRLGISSRTLVPGEDPRPELPDPPEAIDE